MRLYDPSLETELHTDASAAGVGDILLQKQKSGQWAPVAYFSKSTNKAETNYHSYELEMLAIVRAVERFHIYLYGLEFTAVTDCNAVEHAVKKAVLNPRIARWIMVLQDYKFKVVHRAGKRMPHVDALSRIVMAVGRLPLEREFEFKQLKDERICNIASELEYVGNDKFRLIDGLVYRKGDDRDRFIVPDSMIQSIIRVHHDKWRIAEWKKRPKAYTQITGFLPCARKYRTT